jgi:hypothetical protein
MQPGQGASDNPAEDAEAAAMRTADLGRHRHDALLANYARRARDQ